MKREGGGCADPIRVNARGLLQFCSATCPLRDHKEGYFKEVTEVSLRHPLKPHR